MPLSPQTNLAVRLRRLAWRFEQGEFSLRHVDHLASDITAWEQALDRDFSLLKLADMLPRARSDWALAGAVQDSLERFSTTAWPRVQSGGRQPRTPLESALALVMEHFDEVPCRRTIWEILRESRPLKIELADSKTAG